MMSKWDEYQSFSTLAKEHGGAKDYLDFLGGIAKEEGREVGRTEGALATLVVGGVILGGFFAYRKAKIYFEKRKQAKQLSPIVKQEFLSNVEQYEEQEILLNDNKTN